MNRMLEKVRANIRVLDFIAATIAAIVFVFWSFLLFKKYYSFGYCDWDLAFFSQCMYGLLNGQAYSSLFENNLLGNHSNLISYIIAPIFAILPHPLTLVVLKVASYSLAGLILYYIGIPRIGRINSFVILLLYYAYLPNVFGLLHDFDFESLSPVFLMAMILFYERKRWLGFILVSVLTITIKENMPLIVAAFGIYALVLEKDKLRWGVIPLLLGGLSFVFLVKWLIPHMAPVSAGGVHPYSYIYAGLWQDGLFGALGYFLRMLFSEPNLYFLNSIFGVLLFLPLLAVGALFPAVPLLLQHALSSAPTHQSIRYYYILAIAPFVFWALILVIERFRRLIRPLSLVILLLLCFIFYFYQWCFYWPMVQQSFSCYSCQQPTRNDIKLQWDLIRLVPKNVGVIATFGYLTQLADIPDLYAFHKLYFKVFQRPGNQWRMPQTVKYALINLDDPWFYHDAPADEQERHMYVLRLLGGADSWSFVAQAGQTVLLKKRE